MSQQILEYEGSCGILILARALLCKLKLFNLLMEITLCGKQNLYGKTHNKSRIRVLPACDLVNRKANQIGIEILSLNLYPSNI